MAEMLNTTENFEDDEFLLSADEWDAQSIVDWFGADPGAPIPGSARWDEYEFAHDNLDAWVLLSNEDFKFAHLTKAAAQMVLGNKGARANYKRHLPGKHNQKDHAGKGAKAAAPLDNEQYESLRPQSNYSRETYLNSRMMLEETQAGKDLYSIVDKHASSFTGAANVSNDTWMVAKGKSTGDPKRDREAKALIEASRHTPKDMIPGKLYRGLNIDDLDDLGAKPGDEIELPSSAFSSSRAMARTFAEGKKPVLIEFDTKDGAQALPIQNLTPYQEQHSLQEFVGMGKFKVDSIENDPTKSGHTIMKIRQTGMF